MDDRLVKMNQLAAEISNCSRCQLHLSRKKSVPGEGNISTKILFIGEGPGLNENESGRPFVGQAGNFLNELLSVAKVNRSDVFITNVVKCRPPANRDPMPEELSACAAFLDKQIEIINPLVIVTLGRFSMAKYFPLQRISMIHGKGHWIGDRLVVPMFHPAAALHQPNLRTSILHDFALLPNYLKEAAARIVATQEEEIPAPELAKSLKIETELTDHLSQNDVTQLSLF
ncbi:uracil-DNA glycosylase [Flexilinea flocculi]|jgi:DNA polymerase|uniref:Type-4 uracil-DNA glycosylase n=1 Tax=Flexilinea flocculi TaxID=1678840 RepID=A0A0K8P9B0_9CHLR|nr:uracil-DNA glycosylase [Flexilinea flocculi]NMB93642.1 uracil-DNA glycosylase [Flexilinea flocculi]GAP39109.1 uracil-DNA glycosylase, family 4 [Flexilinea flocculi]